MIVITGGEMVAVTVRGSRSASLVGSYWNDVTRFIESGDVSLLASYRGKKVAGFLLETDPDVLTALFLVEGDGPDGDDEKIVIYSDAAA